MQPVIKTFSMIWGFETCHLFSCRCSVIYLNNMILDLVKRWKVVGTRTRTRMTKNIVGQGRIFFLDEHRFGVHNIVSRVFIFMSAHFFHLKDLIIHKTCLELLSDERRVAQVTICMSELLPGDIINFSFCWTVLSHVNETVFWKINLTHIDSAAEVLKMLLTLAVAIRTMTVVTFIYAFYLIDIRILYPQTQLLIFQVKKK